MVDEQQVRKILQTVKHPKVRRSFLDLGMIRDIAVDGDAVHLTLALKSENSPLRKGLEKQIDSALRSLPGVSHVHMEVTEMSREEWEQIFPPPVYQGIARVKQIVAVASGKGGVGKTTVAVNIALALAGQGLRVGLMDADIYGPSIPIMLDLTGTPESLPDGMIRPFDKYGLKIMSLGMTAREDEAFIWRGPLVDKMIRHLLGNVQWGELDYLIVDLPPGTGDPSITIAKAIPSCRILMVTTPQKVALADVRRAIGLFRRYNLKIIGLVENMSSFVSSPGAAPLNVFGHGGGERLSREYDLPLLGTIPLDLTIRSSEDRGLPLMAAEPESPIAAVFQGIARMILEVPGAPDSPASSQ
jgi:ATP-binding protein involved in chromosome partitioning